MRSVIYARESLDDTNKAPPITEQIARAKQYAQEKNIEIVNTYSDNGYSGGDWNRPAWNKLKNDAKFHSFNLVIVFSQDRIARDTEQFLHFYRILKESDVKIYSITEGDINMESVGDRIKHTSLAQAAEIFRLITSEKVKKVYESCKSKAQKEGTPLIWGRKPIIIDLDKIIALRRQGLGYRQITTKVGGVSYQTIRRVLQKALPENSAISKENLIKTRNKNR